MFYCLIFDQDEAASAGTGTGVRAPLASEVWGRWFQSSVISGQNTVPEGRCGVICTAVDKYQTESKILFALGHEFD